MLRNLLVILVVAATATSCTSAPEFELTSRGLFEGPARDAAILDGNIILAAGGAVRVIAEGTPPEEGLVVPLGGKPMDITVTGSADRDGADATVWIAVNGVGVVAIDLSDPANPREWTAYEIKDALSCAVAGQFLAVNGLKSGLYLFDTADITRPESLTLIGHLEKTASAASLSSSGGVVTVTYGTTAILIDASTGTMNERSRLEAPSKIVAAMLRRSILHLLSPEGVVYRYDVGDPSRPEPLPPLPENNISDICIGQEGGLALLETGLIIPFQIPHLKRSPEGSSTSGERCSISLPSDPRYSLVNVSGITRSPVFPGSAIRYGGEKLVTFGEKTGFHCYGLDKGSTRAIGEVPAEGFAFDLIASGEYVYVANGRDGLRIGRVDESGRIEWTGHAPTEMARDIAIEDDILVLVNANKGVKFYRVGIPDSPVLLSTLDSEAYNSAVKVRAGRAYLAGGLRGIEVVDFSNPEDPAIIWREKLSEVRGLAVDDGYLYVADGLDGFRIYSLAGDVPELMSAMDTPGWVSDLFISGDILHVADGQRGFMTVDVGDRSAPKRLGRVMTGAIARSIHARGDAVFVATQELGITAVDVSVPENPVIAARYQTVDDARGVFADDRFVYLASGSGGLYIFRYKE
jgi:hypothetical protein